MPTHLKTLGQGVSQAAAAVTNLYAPGAGVEAVVSSIVIAETAGAATTFKLAVNPTALGTVAAANCLAFAVPIPANSIVTLTLGITVTNPNQISFSAPGVGLTATVFGQENT